MHAGEQVRVDHENRRRRDDGWQQQRAGERPDRVEVDVVALLRPAPDALHTEHGLDVQDGRPAEQEPGLRVRPGHRQAAEGVRHDQGHGQALHDQDGEQQAGRYRPHGPAGHVP